VSFRNDITTQSPGMEGSKAELIREKRLKIKKEAKDL
jgi:hypothetical protein